MRTFADRNVWELQGTPRQQRVAEQALAACDYPWEVVVPGLRAKTGRDTIPLDWQDLSRYAADVPAAADGHIHDHAHDHDDGEGYHVLEARRRVLGLAWYSGRVTLDTSLENDETLAAEVLLSEGAHMADFFALTDQQRERIYVAFHGGDTTEHGHGWFDVASYREEVGEAFMGGFIRAFASAVDVTIPFAHPATDTVGREIRDVMLAPIVFGIDRSTVFHDAHRGITAERHWPHRAAAEAEGRRGCGVCKPSQGD